MKCPFKDKSFREARMFVLTFALSILMLFMFDIYVKIALNSFWQIMLLASVLALFVWVFKLESNFKKTLKEKVAELEKLACFDILTGLPNRRVFTERLDSALAQASRYGRKLAVLFIDVNKFKLINDELGHKAGDLYLKEIADRATRICKRGSDIVARLGGDEFTILLPEIANVKEAEDMVLSLLEEFKKPFMLKGKEVSILVSIGISLFPQYYINATELLNRADKAMYRAKEQECGYSFYSERTAGITKNCWEILNCTIKEQCSAYKIEGAGFSCWHLVDTKGKLKCSKDADCSTCKVRTENDV